MLRRAGMPADTLSFMHMQEKPELKQNPKHRGEEGAEPRSGSLLRTFDPKR